MKEVESSFWLFNIPHIVWTSIVSGFKSVMNFPAFLPTFFWQILLVGANLLFFAEIIYFARNVPASTGQWLWVIWFIVLTKASARALSQYIYHYRDEDRDIWKGYFILAFISLFYWVTILTVFAYPLLHVFYVLGFGDDKCGVYVAERLLPKKKEGIFGKIKNTLLGAYQTPHKNMLAKISSQAS